MAIGKAGPKINLNKLSIKFGSYNNCGRWKIRSKL